MLAFPIEIETDGKVDWIGEGAGATFFAHGFSI
jgi:hypothetical protein